MNNKDNGRDLVAKVALLVLATGFIIGYLVSMVDNDPTVRQFERAAERAKEAARESQKQK